MDVFRDKENNNRAKGSMADNNDALFREVEEELRREQFQKLWERYGTYILAAAALIVVSVGGVKYWESHKLARSQSAGAEYEAAIGLSAAGKSEDSAKALEQIAANGPAGYAALAELSLAGAKLKAGKRDEALAIFDKLAAQGGADPILANFAKLQAVSLRLGQADFTDIKNRLTPLMADDSSWRYIARELLGTAAVKAGKLEEARTTLAPLLVDPQVPQSAVERVRQVMSTIAVAELAKSPPSAAPAPAGTTTGDDKKPAAPTP
jgi:hypothetical protein